MILLSSVAVMFLAGAAAPLLDRWLGRSAGYPLAAVFAGVLVWLASHAGPVLAGGELVESYAWVPALDVSLTLRMDGLAILFVGLILGVGALVMSYTPRYLSVGSHGRLFTVLTVFAAAMLGLVLSGDIVLMLVFWEVTTLCSFLLIAGQGTVGAWPATRALVVTGSGGLALLGAVVVLVVSTGTSDLATIIDTAPDALSPAQTIVVASLVMLAAFTKSAQVPFHFWLPDAMVAITPVSAYLHAATLVKAGIYLLLRTSPMFADEPAWHIVLMAVGLTTAALGAVFALRQTDLKALLAYSTVSQLGFMVALVGVGTTASLAAATLLTAAHALFKATLFMLVGIIDREAGSRDVRELSGLRKVMPVTAFLTGLAALSMAGVPPLVGFVAKEESFYAFIGASEATWAADLPALGVVSGTVAVLAAAFTLAYSARILVGAFAGPVRQPGLYEPSAAFLAPAALPAVLGLLLGLYPQVLNPLVDRAVADTGVDEASADLALWHGFTIPLAMSAVAISMGLVIHRWGTRMAPVLGMPTRPIAPGVFDRWWAAMLALGQRAGAPHSQQPAAHLLGPALVVVVVLGIGALAVSPVGPVIAGTSRGADLAVLVVLLPAVIVAAMTRRALAALIMVGVVGFALTVWLLLLGAPDVALTLLLVEILTVVVAVPVLRSRSDVLADPSTRARTVASGALAIGLGLAAGATVWLLTGRTPRSFAGDYLLDEAERQTGGSNVVNTVLVDFRGLDTLGEIGVLVAAAAGLGVLLGSIPPAAGRWFRGPETAVLAAGARVTVPALVVVGAVLFWRGHDLPGGGFITGLALGLAVVIARRADWDLPLPSSRMLLAAGLGTATATGLLGLVAAGAFGQPVKASLPLLGDPTTALLFDLGVVGVVLGLVTAAIDRLEAAADQAETQQAFGAASREKDDDRDRPHAGREASS